MLTTPDKWHDLTLKGFVETFGQTFGVRRIAMTGHSQGAALVLMMMVALQEGLPGQRRLARFRGSPSRHPPQATRTLPRMNETCDCWFAIIPQDIVPLGYDTMLDVVTTGIPEPLRPAAELGLRFVIDALNCKVRPDDHWAQPVQQAVLIAK